MAQQSLVLASESVRRIDLLKQIHLTPDVVAPAKIDETPLKNEKPRDYAMRMARSKCDAIRPTYINAFVLAADTVVSCGNRILPKATSDEEVAKYLSILSGRMHTVQTAICVSCPEYQDACRIVSAKVTFKRLHPDEITHYVSSQEGASIAGGYAIQGLAGSFVRRINGSYSAIVGLPLLETKQLLHGVGYVC